MASHVAVAPLVNSLGLSINKRVPVAGWYMPYVHTHTHTHTHTDTQTFVSHYVAKANITQCDLHQLQHQSQLRLRTQTYKIAQPATFTSVVALPHTQLEQSQPKASCSTVQV